MKIYPVKPKSLQVRAQAQEAIEPDQTEMTFVPEPGVKTAFIQQVRTCSSRLH
jgi:hypothetical protein